MSDEVLPFERKLHAIERELAGTDDRELRFELQDRFDQELASVYSRLTPWQRVCLARHSKRPRMLDYVSGLFEEFIELHGDRSQEDDPAMVCGIARFRGRTVFVAGQQKGDDMEEKVMRNFGMAHPSGYRKALRVFKLAARLGFPIVTFVDTPAAHPGIEAEQAGQGPAIATNLVELMDLDTPVLSVVLGEGGSGGAIAIAVADWVAMFQYAVYLICPPERCAEILWRDVEKKAEAASALRSSAEDLHDLGIIDRILPEYCGAAHHHPERAVDVLAKEIAWFLEEADQGHWCLDKRRARYRRMGQWLE